MNLESRGIILCLVAACMSCPLTFSFAAAQTPQQEKLVLSESVFNNVTALKGISVEEFMDTMGMISAALSMNCTDCHTPASLNDWSKFGEDTDVKKTARRMILIMNAINKQNFAGQKMVTCYTCHRGDPRPKVVPSLITQYSLPFEDPNDMDFVAPAGAGMPTPDQVFAKYMQAIGGTQKVNAVTSIVAKGNYS